MNFEGKTALVTGGSRGIGRAICLKLASLGANIVTCYAGGKEAGEETVRLCEAQGVKALLVRADVKDPEAVTQLVDAAKKEFGRIDILVNNAGITRDNLLIGIKEEDFDSVIDTNLKGVYLVTKACARLMMKQRYGRIVNVSSVVGIMGNAGQANYAASKAGVIGFTKSVAKELGSRGITANAVAPGFIKTDMTKELSEEAVSNLTEGLPVKRLGEAEDVANLVSFLASEEASYITGQVICVDGGMCM